MALQRRTIIDRIEILHSGHLQVRLAKQIVDGEAVQASEYHRFVVDPGGDIEHQVAGVNVHLKALGAPAILESDLPQLHRHAAVAWSPAKIAAHEKVAIGKMRPLLEEHRGRLDKARSDLASIGDALVTTEAEIAKTRRALDKSMEAAMEEFGGKIRELREIQYQTAAIDAEHLPEKP